MLQAAFGEHVAMLVSGGVIIASELRGMTCLLPTTLLYCECEICLCHKCVAPIGRTVLQAAFVEHVAKLVNGGAITGVSDVRDESDRDGMRVVLELRKGINAEVIINNLYKQTVLQTTFPCNMVALVDATPQTLNLKQFLQHFLEFRSDLGVWT